MAYYVDLLVPKNTTVSAPQQYILKIAPGIIRKIMIVHPTGSCSLVGVWIEYLSTKIFPVNDDGYFIGNGFPIEFNPDYLVNIPPYSLAIRAYNDDDTYDHTILCMIDMEYSFVSSIASNVLFQQLNESRN